MSRRRGPKGLQVGPGERYALLPREVAESASYNAQTDWSRTVLYGVLLQYHGHNNGFLGLTYPEAKLLGVHGQWKLYAGLRVLCDAALLVCSRRGRLLAGDKLPSLYAVTWKGIDELKTSDVIFDYGVSVSPIPSNAWAKWQKPLDWANHVKNIEKRARGRKATKNPYSPREVKAAPHVSSDCANSRTPYEVKERQFAAPHVVVASKTSASAAGVSAGLEGRIEKLMVMQPHLQNSDLAKILQTEVERVARVRERLTNGRHHP